jgi:CubicO group peptidase (beta-lactamase class C family)
MRRALILSAAAIALVSIGVASAGDAARPTASADASADSSAAMRDLLDYARSQNTTGFLIMRHGKTLVDENWPAPKSPGFGIFVYGKTPDGQLLEDVASQQKSFVSVLVGTAIDKGLIDVDRPVSDYIGAGWTKASPEQEAKIRVIDVLTMSSGLNEKFAYEAPAGTRFFYNTAVYAITKKILTAATKMPLDRITREWLTQPLGMKDTAWRQRPAVLANVGNNTGLVTTPRDTAIFGQMILAGGVSRGGATIISAKSLHAMFGRSCCNPAYGRLWWLNGGDYVVGAEAKRKAGPLIPAAPADLVAALGYLDRRLYVVPSLDLIVVRTGAAAPDKDFDQQLWLRLMRVVG